MSETLIELRDVGLTLPSQAGDVEILRGIDLTVRRGERLALVGPSGSGKTSLLMIVGGMERATAGSVRVLGADLGALGEDRLARLRRGHIGVVFQTFHLIPTMTALENVATPLELAGRRDAFDRAAEMLAEVGLGHRERHYPAQLSGGEQQRVALARALAPAPALLLADEPTGNLDGRTGAAVADLMFRLVAEQAATLLLVTHAQALARRCSRVLAMQDGRVGAGQAAVA
ncbi:MAG TPA: ATP-binding cassette domain-containing protein [Thermohalobaculum sp.]|nr:ATP-binding cassette domain-containing protein [Thermohalobaculum sp.]